jgi:hypothetical protein
VLRASCPLTRTTRLASSVSELRTFIEQPIEGMEVGALIRHCVHGLSPGAPPARRLDGVPYNRYMLWRKLTRAMVAIASERTIAAAAEAANFAESRSSFDPAILLPRRRGFPGPPVR